MKYSIGGEDLLKIIERASTTSESPINQDLIVPDSSANIEAPFKNSQRRPYFDIFNRVFIDRTDSNVSSEIEDQDPGITSVNDSNPTGSNIVAAEPVNIPNLSNRILINYKNHVVKEKVNGTNQVLFYNKIKETESNLSDEKWFNPSINNIVEQFGQSQQAATSSRTNISYSDFLYCKKLGAYPNNRLVILRRFADPVHDDLLEYPFGVEDIRPNQLPMAVMVTWFDEFPVKISFQDKFERYTEGGLFAAISEAIQQLTPGGSANTYTSVKSKIKGKVDSLSGSPWLNAFWYQALNQVYQETSVETNAELVLPQPANPNFIREAVIKTGIESNISADLTFTYVMRQIGNVDPHIAMHALIANSIRMGTSTSINLFPTEIGERGELSDMIRLFAEGKIIQLISNINDNLSKIIESITNGQDVNNPTSNNNTAGAQTDQSPFKGQTQQRGGSGFDFSDFAGRSLRLALSLYRFKIMAALAADTGVPSGHWHLTVGNPFNPILSIGDLTLGGDVDISFNNELSYQDFPTELTVKVRLKSARSRGAQELERIFNAGRGRIYVYPRDTDNPDLFTRDENIYRGDPVPTNREIGLGADEGGQTARNLIQNLNQGQ